MPLKSEPEWIPRHCSSDLIRGIVVGYGAL